MARSETFQTNFNGGIADARLADREDLDVYFNAVKDAFNMRPSPQGGMGLRGGLAYVGRLRGTVSAISLDDAVVTFAADGDSGGAAASPPPPPDDPLPYPDFDGRWGRFEFSLDP